MKHTVKFLALILVVLLSSALLLGCATTAGTAETAAPAGTARTLDEIKASGKVTIGVFSDKAPFGYVDSDGKYQGYDVYFAERIAKDLGVTVEYVSVDPANRVEYLQSAKVDIILANFTVTAERAEKVDFALPYLKVALGVVSPDGAQITDVEQLNGKTLIVAKGTTAETFFTNNYPNVTLLKFDSYTDAYNALLDGRGDAFSTDNTEVLAWALQNKGFTVGIESLGSLDTIAPAVQKGNTTLLDWLNEEIKALGAENFFHADYAATLQPVYGDAVNPEALIVEGGVVDTEAAATPAEPVVLKVGASPTPHAQILAVVKELLAAQNIDLQIVEYTDYVQPNVALAAGDLDANYFQHQPYLDQYNAENGTSLVPIVAVHFEPLGIYAGKAKSLAELADGAQVAVPNDATNEARALLLLEAQGLIKLAENVGIKATVNDIVENPKNLKIVEIEAAQLARSLQDVDIAVINGNYAIEAGLNAATDALASESPDSVAATTFANELVVRSGDETRPELVALAAALTSEEVRAFITETFGGAVVPVF